MMRRITSGRVTAKALRWVMPALLMSRSTPPKAPCLGHRPMQSAVRHVAAEADVGASKSQSL
jgi:hypothetical protein